SARRAFGLSASRTPLTSLPAVVTPCHSKTAISALDLARLRRREHLFEARDARDHEARAVLAQGAHAPAHRDLRDGGRVAVVQDLTPHRLVEDQHLADRDPAAVARVRARLAADGPVEDRVAQLLRDARVVAPPERPERRHVARRLD